MRKKRDPLNLVVAKRLKIAIQRKVGFCWYEIADKIGVSREILEGYLQARCALDESELILICKGLKINFLKLVAKEQEAE